MALRRIANVDEAAGRPTYCAHLSEGPVDGGLRVTCVECGAETAEVARAVRNLWRTRVIAIDEIHRIDLATKRGDHASPPHWVPRIDLTNGDSIWIEGFSCGIAHRPPDPEGLAALGELRALIGLQTIAY